MEGTISTSLMRLLIEAARASGSNPGELGPLRGLGDELLRDDFARLPVEFSNTLWKILVTNVPETDLTSGLLSRAPIGALGVWDHLYAASPTVLEGVQEAFRYVNIHADPATESAVTIEDGELVTIGYASMVAEPEVAAAVPEFALGLFLGRMTDAAGRRIAPVHASLTRAAPRRHGHLTDLFGTRRIDFGASRSSVTFLASDLAAATTGARPGLANVLRQHAEMTIAAARPVLDWTDRFRAALAGSLADGPSIEAVAHRLGLSTRSLQRRLAEHGTTWSDEVAGARREQATRLLDAGADLRAISARVGYSDVRALRRAVRRWHEESPGDLPGDSSAG